MQAMTITEAQRNLAEVIASVVSDAEPIIICTDSGEQVVCLPLDEFNSWKETLHLLSNPANAEHLRRSIVEAKAGAVECRELND